jgi:hypothetical protein
VELLLFREMCNLAVLETRQRTSTFQRLIHMEERKNLPYRAQTTSSTPGFTLDQAERKIWAGTKRGDECTSIVSFVLAENSLVGSVFLGLIFVLPRSLCSICLNGYMRILLHTMRTGGCVDCIRPGL